MNPQPAGDEIVLSAVNGDVVTITLNRPAALNALTAEMVDRVRALLDAAADSSTRCVVITGAGRAFSAGQDLQDAAVDTNRSEPPDLGALLADHYAPLIQRIATMPVPVVAAVNGVAAGAGANLALACDLVVAKASANFIQAFIKIGLIPDVAGTWLLPRLTGRARALGLAMLGEPVPADEAERIGLIWRSVPDEDFDEAVASLSVRLAAGPTSALVAARRLIDAATHLDLESALASEADVQRTLGRGPDFAEGVAAFRERRQPQFRI